MMCLLTVVFTCVVVLQGPQYPCGFGGFGGLEWFRQMLCLSRPFYYTERVFGLEETQTLAAETTRQCPAN